MKEIPLSKLGKYKGMFSAIVDDADYDRLSELDWYVLLADPAHIYARCKRQGKNVLMHRLILGTEAGIVVDHIDGNGLNNRRSNLREATHQQNSVNSKKPQTGTATSKYKGVYFYRRLGKWCAQIKVSDAGNYLGLYDTQEAAARAYDAKSLELFGEFARLNFPK